MHISFLTHFLMTSLVIFAELCNFFVMKSRQRVSIFVVFLSAILIVVLAQFFSDLSIVFNFTVLNSICFFTLVKWH